MKKKTQQPEPDFVIIAVNGINTLKSDDSWNNLAEIYFAGKRILCHAFQYFSDTVFRRMFQQDRVKRLSDLCRRYETFDLDIILLVHSNGGDLALRLLKVFSGRIKEIHFIAAAADNDCRRNGLNQAIKDGRVGKVFFYCSKNDRALKGAKLSKKLFGWAGFGYDYVGLVGPSYIEDDSKFDVIWKNEYDHSDWIQEGNFDFTFCKVGK